MMKQSQLLAKRFREVILDGKWVSNTNYKDQLSELPFEKAIAKVGNLNTIAILAQHIHYYIAGVNHALKGGSLDIRDAHSFDFPAMESEESWKAFLERFWSDAQTFSDLVENLDNDMLKEPFVDKKYGTYLRNIDGMIEHCYYHLGQIVLINKLISFSENQNKI